MTDACALLAFDTSTQAMAVALQAGGRTWLRNAEGGAAASATLLPLVCSLLAEAGTALERLDAIAFGRGPGAFTGLRTSCAVAQGLALGSGRPVLAIDSLQLVAEQARIRAGAGPLDLGVVMDARMGELYAARWHWDGSGWQALHEPRLSSPQALAEAWAESPPRACTGSGRPLAQDVFRQRWGHGHWIDEGDDRAGALLQLAQQAWHEGRMQDAAEALPVYVRDKVALTTAERAAQGAR